MPIRMSELDALRPIMCAQSCQVKICNDREISLFNGVCEERGNWLAERANLVVHVGLVSPCWTAVTPVGGEGTRESKIHKMTTVEPPKTDPP